ncbi:glucan 1,3-beta-glucosidase [Acrasis kona]|uniref:glucan 1,3-beta-glucosidase n=1 Tax=Acrasis kona TaxID=1008807 RepID=A0AAW2ZDK2_9EUKA
MKLILVLTFLTALALCEHVQYAIRRGDVKCRGVNLGGWLVLEHWMTWDSPAWRDVPEDVANRGEHQMMKLRGHAQDGLIRQHRQNWITEQDIAEISQRGLNSVRVPVGYWITEDKTGGQDWKLFTPGAINYLDVLVRDWAKKHNIAVMVSLHAAKGSQNGNDHSAPADSGKEYWSQYPENVANTIDVIAFLTERYKDDEAFLGVGMLNEPGGSTDQNIMRKFYTDTYNRVRKHSDCILSHMPFLSEQRPWSQDWASFMKASEGFRNVWHEWHKYLYWGYESLNEDQILAVARGELTNDFKNWQGNYLVDGEWSLTTAAKFYDDNRLREFARAYVGALNNGHAGWFYWTWKVSGDESGGRNTWSMRRMLRDNIL